MAIMIHRTSNVIISITADGDILFIQKGTKDGLTTSRRATFLDYDGISGLLTPRRCVINHFKNYLGTLLESLSTNEVITITITTHKNELNYGNIQH